MDTAGQTRTLGSIDSHISVASNFTLACEDLINWIKLVDLKKEQIISISASETSTYDADAVLVLTYRTEQEPSMASLAQIQFELLKNVVDWKDQYAEIQRTVLGQNVEVLSLTHTARNIGQINIQILWYIPSLTPNQYTCKHFTNFGDLQGLLGESLQYCNTYVAPHNLVSLSVFEDDHPCPKQHYHVVVYHKGITTKPLEKPADIQGDLYSLREVRADGWEEVNDQALDIMERQGTEQTRFTTSTYNCSEHDQKAVAILSWSKIHEDTLNDLGRGGCNCAIF